MVQSPTPNSIGSFRELSQAFIKQFISGIVREKSLASLMGLVQGANESLRDYLNRFTKEALKVPDLDKKVAIIDLKQGTRDEFFKMSLAKHPPESMLSQILLEIEKDQEFIWLKPLRGDPEKRNKGMYYRFHKDVAHDTVDCRPLKDEVEYLIRRGKFGKFSKGEDARGQKRDNDRRGNDQDRNPQPRGPVINMISGGPICVGTIKNSRKAYAREVMNIVRKAPKRAKTMMTLEFGVSDLEGLKFLQDDPLVITPIIENCPVKIVLV
ncbi:uncharacterized protein LOC141686181 [Apium graveolens]|uniref:uncharacterized protein LOC141686181 n=1 Tax=Apium graveolens TaxID=4045 RepID=UPI003D7B978D